MKFQDWFDPSNKRHMEIYKEYITTYAWPDCEEINNLDQSDRIHWYLISYARMASHWFYFMEIYEKFTEETKKEMGTYIKII